MSAIHFLRGILHVDNSTHDSELYSQDMVQGMISGLRFKFPGDAEIYSETEIIIEKKRFRLSSTYLLGDIDIIIRKRAPIALKEYLPKSGYIIRPVDWDNERLINGFFGEMKVTCDKKHAREKLKQFVRFYHKFLKYYPFERRMLRKKNLANGKLKPADLGDDILEFIANPSTPIIFCFNGSDCSSAWTTLLKTIKAECGGPGNVSTIRGHQVLIIFCKSDDLAIWQRLIMSEQALLEAQQALLKSQQARLEAQQERLEAQQALLKAKQERLEAQQALLKAKQARLEAERALLKPEQALLKAEQERLKAEQTRLEAEQTRLEAVQERLETEQTRLEAEHALSEESRLLLEEARI